MSSFAPGSYGSFILGSNRSSSVREAFEAYRRSQRYFTEAISAPATDDELDEFDHEEQSVIDEEEEAESPQPARSYDPYAAVGNLQWDEDLTPVPLSSSVEIESPSTSRPFLIPVLPQHIRRPTHDTIRPASRDEAREETPLLRKTTSLTFSEPRRPVNENVLPSIALPIDGPPVTMVRRASHGSIRSTMQRRGSTTSRVTKGVQAGQSTFGQTLFNAIAILLGIGMLSEPLAFAYAGWIWGTVLITSYGWITCYTAKILAHIILDDPKLRSYSDIGRKAFGGRSGPIISALFCLELFTVRWLRSVNCSVALVTLYADSLHSVVPAYSANTYKVLGLLVLVPTVLMPLSVLSYASVLGILSTLFLVLVMFIDGWSKKEGPGSLWSPAETSFNFGSLGQLGLSFGLFMAGLSGHAVIPSLARDMIDPSQFDHMIEWAFAIATLIYSVIGVTGYLMFGNNVSDEFSQDLMTTVGYNKTLNQVALWGLVIAPLSKFALATRPLNITLEIMLGIEHGPHSHDDHGPSASKPNSPALHSTAHERSHGFKRTFTVIERAIFTMVSVAVSILVPEFSSMMAFLGSFSAFLICVIGPVSAKVALAGRCGIWDGILLAIAVIMAVWGTGAAIWSGAKGGV